MLDNFKVKLDCCLSGEDAIKKIKEKRSINCCQSYSIIFMDIDMPIMDGFETS